MKKFQNSNLNFVYFLIVFRDVTVGTAEIGRILFELFADVAPKTSENFRQFCTGEYRKDGIPYGYKGASIHRVIKDFMVQGGDFVNVRVFSFSFNHEKYITD